MVMAFLHGFILALGLILPLGVQNLFVLQQGILQPRLWKTVPAVVTAALCDTVLISCSVGGVAWLLAGMESLRLVLWGAGSLFLFYMGWTNWRSSFASQPTNAMGRLLTARQQIVFAMSVSFLNPYAFMDIMCVIGTSSLEYAGVEKLAFTAAAVLVSWLWFTLLSCLGHVLDRLPDGFHNPCLIQRFSAFFMWGSALYLLLQEIQ